MSQQKFPSNLVLWVPSYGSDSFILIPIGMIVELCPLAKARFNNVMVSSWSFNFYVTKDNASFIALSLSWTLSIKVSVIKLAVI